MTWIIAISAFFGCWAMLRILGGERERQMQELRLAAQAMVPQGNAASATPTKPAAKPNSH